MALNRQSGNMYPWVTHTYNTIKGQCPHDCSYCLGGETLVLMTDFSLKPIKNLKIGEKVIGFGKGTSRYRILVETTVDAISRHKEIAYSMITDTTEVICSQNHRWLTNHNRWRSLGNHLHIGTEIKKIYLHSSCQEVSEAYKKGYLRGIILGDGTMGIYQTKKQSIIRNGRHYNYSPKTVHKFRLSMKDISAIERAKEYLNYFGIQVFKHIHMGLYSIRKDGKNSFETIKKIISPDEEPEFLRGYLAGMFDAEGSFSQGILRIHNKNLEEVEKAFKYFCFRYKLLESKNGIKTITLCGGLSEQIRFISFVSPAIKRKTQGYLKHPKTGYSKILSIKDIGIQELYDIQTGTGNFIANGLISHNCYMHRFPQKPVRLDEKELETDLGKNNTIFVGSSCDMWAEDIPAKWIYLTLNHIMQYPDNTYLFQSKNPKRFDDFILPPKVILGTTMETNWVNAFSHAPSVLERYSAMKQYKVRKMVSVEPIMDFDLAKFATMLKDIEPEFVSIGADSKGHNLPEPSKDKVLDLICELNKFTDVKIKRNLGRIIGKEV